MTRLTGNLSLFTITFQPAGRPSSTASGIQSCPEGWLRSISSSSILIHKVKGFVVFNTNGHSTRASGIERSSIYIVGVNKWMSRKEITKFDLFLHGLWSGESESEHEVGRRGQAEE